MLYWPIAKNKQPFIEVKGASSDKTLLD